MSTLFQASRQWAKRPDDERFTSLDAMQAHFEVIRAESVQRGLPSRRLFAQPLPDNVGMEVVAAADGRSYAPTHWAFGQLAKLAEAPAGYLRTMPAPIAADCPAPRRAAAQLFKCGTWRLSFHAGEHGDIRARRTAARGGGEIGGRSPTC